MKSEKGGGYKERCSKRVLSEQEIKSCVLVLLKVEGKMIAEILLYSSSSTNKIKASLAQTLEVSSAKLRDFLIKKAIGIS